jgi:cytochrome c5
MAEEQDRQFFRNYMIIIGMLGLMIVAFIVFAVSFGTKDDSYVAERSNEVAEMTRPYGRVHIEGQAEPVVEVIQEETSATSIASTSESGGEGGAEDLGKKVYSSLCFSCHGTGLPNIPQLGDVAAWESRIAEGNALLYERAITGFTGKSGMPMPAKGGNPALSDDEIRAAVDYMVSNSQ